MTEENDKKEASVSASGVGRITGSAKATIAFSADNIRKRLENEEFALAIVLTSTRLENILTRGLRRRIEVDENQFEALWGNETLGTYGQMCAQLDVFGDEFNQEVIDDVTSLRNNLVHDYGYLNDIEENEDLQQEVSEVIESAINFIESIQM